MTKLYFTTPYGEAIYPWLNRPDTQFDANGVYHLKLRVPMEEAAEFIDSLRTVRDQFIAEQDPVKQKNWNVAEVYDDEFDDEGNPTGNVLFKLKQRAFVSYKAKDGTEQSFTQKPEIVDEDGNTVSEAVWGGTTLRAKGEIRPYAMASSKTLGVSLRLSAVQVKELVTGTARATFEDSDSAGVMPGRAS